MPTIIDGKTIAARCNASTADDIAALRARGIIPGLAVVLLGDHPASRAYVRSKDKTCRELGMHSRKIELPASTSQEELLRIVTDLNADPTIHGILVQSPPPPHIDEAAIVRAIDPRKDVDGFHPVNVAALAMDETAATLSGEQTELLKKGFEYATQVVKMLEKEPAPEEKLDVRFLFWGVGEELFLDRDIDGMMDGGMLTGNQ